VAAPIFTRLLGKVYGEGSEQAVKIRQEILQSIFAHEDEIKCLSIEAGISKIADGCDMAEGRARIPYKLGKVDIHSLSALSITKVEVERGQDKPLRITVHMNNSSGVFQIEEVLMRKIETSGLMKETEVIAIERGKEIKRI
jgi:metal-dependent HD superfamily phosphatase/phosphodiesterase